MPCLRQAVQISRLVRITESTTSSTLFRAGSLANGPLTGLSTQPAVQKLSRCYASDASDSVTEPEHGLVWPPRHDALKSNPVLAYALQSAAKHSRAELGDRINKLLKKQQGSRIAHSELQHLKDEDVEAELAQCGLKPNDSKTQSIAQLYKVLEQHDSAATEAELTANSRDAEAPALRDDSPMAMSGTERLPFVTIASPREIADMLVAAKTDDVCILDVSRQCSFTENMVLATGRSHRHVQAAAAAVAYQLSLRCTEVEPGARPKVEGEDDSDWLVVDAGSVIVHVFNEDARAAYDLDGLWRSADNQSVT